MRLFLLLSASVLVIAAANAQDRREAQPLPKSTPPRFVIARAKVDGEEVGLVLHVPIRQAKWVIVPLIPKDPRFREGQRTEEVKVYETRLESVEVQPYFLSLADQDSLTQYVTTRVQGKEESVDRRTVLNRLREPTVVLLADEGNVDPLYLSICKDDVLIVVPGYHLRVDLQQLHAKEQTDATEAASPSTQADAPPAKQLEELKKQVETVIPPRWMVELDPDRPALVVRSRDKLQVVSNSINIGPRQNEQVVSIRFDVVPHVTPEEFATLRQTNEDWLQQRTEFADRHLSTISAGEVTKGGFIEYPPGRRPSPCSPDSYQPKTENQEDLLAEYRLLWKRTQPRPVPTHHAQSTSFRLQSRPDWRYSHSADGKLVTPSPVDKYWTITDHAAASEYDDLVKKIQQVLHAY